MSCLFCYTFIKRSHSSIEKSHNSIWKCNTPFNHSKYHTHHYPISIFLLTPLKLHTVLLMQPQYHDYAQSLQSDFWHIVLNRWYGYPSFSRLTAPPYLLIRPRWLEHLTRSLEGYCSIQLSYGRNVSPCFSVCLRCSSVSTPQFSVVTPKSPFYSPPQSHYNIVTTVCQVVKESIQNLSETLSSLSYSWWP